MLPADAGGEVGRKPTVAAGAGAAAAYKSGRWDCGGTPSGTWGSTAGWSCYDLPLLCVLVCADRIIRDDDITDELWE
jgi:hypothetical protein